MVKIVGTPRNDRVHNIIHARIEGAPLIHSTNEGRSWQPARILVMISHRNGKPKNVMIRSLNRHFNASYATVDEAPRWVRRLVRKLVRQW